jgi:6-phosphogluconolactonase
MKFGKVGQVGLVSALALIVATLFTACGTLTVGFLFVPTNRVSPGSIEVFEVNSLSGVLRTIPTSPFPSGGRNPIAEAVSGDAKNLYVVNGDDNNVVQFGIGTDGKLYPQSTLNTPGSFPIAIVVNSGGTFAFVLDTLEPTAGCTPTNPCSGALASYAVTAPTSTILPGSLGLAPAGCTANPLPSGFDSSVCTVGNAVVNNDGLTYVPLQLDPASGDVLTPTAMTVPGNGSALYVSAYDSVRSRGYLFAFSVDSSGSMAALNNGMPYDIGLNTASDPVALASDSGGQHLFVVDKVGNRVLTYALNADGTLPSTTTVVNLKSVQVAIAQSTAGTGDAPSALAFYTDQFAYVTNSFDSTVDAFSVSSGNLSKIATYASDNNPIGIISDPGQNGLLYTVNFLGSSLSGYKIDPTTGALVNSQASPYRTNPQPTAITGIPHAGQKSN